MFQLNLHRSLKSAPERVGFFFFFLSNKGRFSVTLTQGQDDRTFPWSSGHLAFTNTHTSATHTHTHTDNKDLLMAMNDGKDQALGVLLHNHKNICLNKEETFSSKPSSLIHIYCYYYYLSLSLNTSWPVCVFFFYPYSNPKDYIPNLTLKPASRSWTHPAVIGKKPTLPTWHTTAAATLRYNPTTWANVSPTLHSSSRSHGSAASRQRVRREIE